MLIFGAGAAATAGIDETGSEIGTVNVDRNMAQAFEFPKGSRMAENRMAVGRRSRLPQD
ncbi:hypothetical protein [Bradyrhizobium elkanii]|uniref:Uncharacterized protein n=1 Tax=Bradyrhizobium elkanii TaxID=29448 RepID=A0A4Y3ZS66_BRAEL|nr:hypothetical protein [Bradyrhizobium elkanii]MBP1296824.1 hypothetical protein [Bradyrhizobium elkanii]MBP2426141.1 hypothetical protein [Bradyrhizobium elkanii]MCP1749384.1 hypothetical protein [Bradyrhizobium elkanii]MCP1969277.1 hypothetical protein [Bradyrhizobium elkanii]MCP1983956.1 hypothetical protein [Bradyrhizobium elkanii]